MHEGVPPIRANTSRPLTGSADPQIHTVFTQPKRYKGTVRDSQTHSNRLLFLHSTNSTMSAPVVAPAPAIKAVKVKKASAPKKAGTDYVGLIKTAILELKERGGSSVLAIRKAVAPKIPKAVSSGWELRLSGALKSMVKSGKLVRHPSCDSTAFVSRLSLPKL